MVAVVRRRSCGHNDDRTFGPTFGNQTGYASLVGLNVDLAIASATGGIPGWPRIPPVSFNTPQW